MPNRLRLVTSRTRYISPLWRAVVDVTTAVYRSVTMTLRIGLLAVWVAALAGTDVGAPLAAPSDLTTRLAKSLRSPSLPAARTSALAVDLRSGEVVFASNEAIPAVPASNEKLPVAWAALSRLGPGYRFRTELVGRGRRVGNTWQGDLVLRGYGDPTLATGDLHGLAATIRARGITRVNGWIRGDESFFDAKRSVAGWKPQFLGIESAPLSALVVDRAAGWPKYSPPLLAAKTLRAALVRRGVDVVGAAGLGRAPAEAKLLGVDHSASLAVVVRAMNRDSDNFTAEMMLKHLGAIEGRMGTTARGAEVVHAEMRAAGIPMSGVRIVDGSGLSTLDRLTAVALVGVIRAGLENPRIRVAFVGSLSVSGRSGTLRNRLSGLTGVIRGKTGTTSLACTLSGLVNGSVVFAVLQNGSPVAFWPARIAQDSFVTTLAKSRFARAATTP